MRRLIYFLLWLGGCGTAIAQTPPASIIYPGGQYLIVTPGATTIVWTENSVTFSWVTPAIPVPPAPPTPTPGPQPVPAPPAPSPIPQIVGTIFAIQIADGSPAPAQQVMAKSTTIQPSLAKLNSFWYAWTTQSPEAACWVNDPEVKKVGFPALLLVTANGSGNAVLSHVMKEPDSEAAVVAAIQAARETKAKK